MNAQHSNQTMEHGTPTEIVELVRHVAGGVIGTDPFSSSYWQTHSVQATWFYDKEHDGLRAQWQGFCLVNPPGGEATTNATTGKRTIVTPSLVRPAWESLVERWRTGSIDGAVWVSFSLEQLCMLQGSPAHPLQFPTCVPCERLRYLTRPAGGGPPKPGNQPTHASALTILPSRRNPAEARAQLRRFVDGAARLGPVVRPF